MNPLETDIAAVQSIPAVTTILEVVCRITGMGFAAVARVTDARWIACAVLDKIHFGLEPGGELKLETTLCHEIHQSRQSVIIDHVAQDEVYCRHHTPAMYGFQSYISFPIILPDNRFFGTLCAIDPQPNRLNTPEIIGMFKLFAELIAFHLSALERVTLSETQLLEERRNSELREQFIAVLGHDLRNPLGAISSGAELLQRAPLSDSGARIVAMMRKSVARMSGLIDDVMDFARGRLGGGLSLTLHADAALESALHQVIAELGLIWPGRRIDAEYALTEPVTCDLSRITQLLSNVLGNALTYGAPEQPVWVRAVSRDGIFELSVANAGPALSAATRERLFQPFSRGQVQPNQQGLGLGLYIAAEIARAHGGELRVVSTWEQTRFTLQMPTNPART